MEKKKKHHHHAATLERSPASSKVQAGYKLTAMAENMNTIV